MKKVFEVVVKSPGEQVEVEGRIFAGQLIPRILYVLPTGSTEDRPSFCWEMHDADGNVYLSQITHDMLTKGLAAVDEYQHDQAMKRAFGDTHGPKDAKAHSNQDVL